MEPAQGRAHSTAHQPRPRRAAAVVVVLTLLAATSASSARAESTVPWTPSSTARHALELLVDDGGLALPVTQWPLPRAAVVRALDALPRELPPGLAGARAAVERELGDAARPAVVAALRGRNEALVGFGDEGIPGSRVELHSGTALLAGAAAQLGVRLDEGTDPARSQPKLRLDDSAVGFDVGGALLQAWAHRSWWGPGWQSSLILGNNAPPAVGIGLQRASAAPSRSPWLSWLGPWTYDLFVARNDDAIGSTLVGTRLTLRPFSFLELALSRTAQWGGSGHSESADSFWRMLAAIGVNSEDPRDDPANEMSGYDLRVRCPASLRCVGYAQLIGEDATRSLPGRFLGLYGVEIWSADGRHRWLAEYAETICGAVFEHNPVRPCAYRNSRYPEGYASAGRWLGASQGADSRLLTLGWIAAEQGTSLRLHAGRIGSRVGVVGAELDPAHSGRIYGVNARQQWTWQNGVFTAEADWIAVDAPQGRRQQARAGLSVRVAF
jgi:hypothetical protein